MSCFASKGVPASPVGSLTAGVAEGEGWGHLQEASLIISLEER